MAKSVKSSDKGYINPQITIHKIHSTEQTAHKTINVSPKKEDKSKKK